MPPRLRDSAAARTLVAEVNFSAWTHDGHLRHPSFKGIRELEDHAEVLDLAVPEHEKQVTDAFPGGAGSALL